VNIVMRVLRKATSLAKRMFSILQPALLSYPQDVQCYACGYKAQTVSCRPSERGGILD
jgi:hypothetical protein